jgi:hypothetical protein
MYGTYTVTLQELKAVIKARTLADQTNVSKTTGQQINKEDDFQEVRRRKRCATDKTTGTSKNFSNTVWSFELFLFSTLLGLDSDI